jgi:hypothetical protein
VSTANEASNLKMENVVNTSCATSLGCRISQRTQTAKYVATEEWQVAGENCEAHRQINPAVLLRPL